MSQKRVRYTQSTQEDAGPPRPMVRRKASSKAVVKMPPKQAIPTRLVNTLRYAETVTITLNGSGIGYYTFYANGIYDPNHAAGGHQPHYYDQMTKLYNHWRVISSKIVVRQMYTPPSNGHVVTLLVDDDGTPSFSNTFDPQERQGAKSYAAQAGAKEPLGAITQTYNAKKWWGAEHANATQIGDLSTNPSESVMYVLAVTGTALDAFLFNVYIEYQVEWTEIKTVESS